MGWELKGTIGAGLSSSTSFLTFSVPGPLVVGPGTLRIPATKPMTIVTVRAAVNTAPTGASIIFDVNKNGVSIYPTAAKPTIAAGAFDSGNKAPNTTALSAGNYLQVDVDQIGSTVAGADAVLVIEVLV